ncbi:ASKHA domain-containing protein [Oceanispirochaeta sp.]|jgi:uncharacterized 2Fe-2S/4Fe-4S cluster protein (DUF4445 family)|uniref:ASKHA domain-containing protein n=1 Tax=Oceanispirochaeta sp. TaxID=2035350 RepID=UPI0026085F30|nr:ASKHA domain-containing protein [Oceanispirochaeta sp.]MDA3957816.1 ASKHA domain-containing protein [Oceanispirochaeta sp.]
MNSTTFTLHDGPRIINETMTPGENLLSLIHSIPSVNMDAPCGGKGTCGKCRVRILEGKVSPLSDEERKFLSPDEIEKGIRLACLTHPEGSIAVSLESSTKTAKIKVSGGLPYRGNLNPLLRKEVISLTPASLEDQRSLETRMLHALPEGTILEHPLRKKLAKFQKEEQYIMTASLCGKTITDLTPGASGTKPYALAVDIGTTTIVAYLLDLTTGMQIGTASGLNNQKSFGADVISRIDYIGDDNDKLSQLQQRICTQIEDLASETLKGAGLVLQDLMGIFTAGNTTMMHILQGLSPQTIAQAPFIPVSTEAMILKPSELASSLPDHIRFILLPSLSGYIGADIIAGILSTEMAESDDLCLLVDIGTNGEIALGNRDRLISCSTAAGPAFEGANIQCGVGGIPGAISCFREDGEAFEWETIDDKPVCGICGSGIIDLTAYLLKTKLADFTGRFQDDSDWGDNPPVQKSFLKELDGNICFTWGDEQKSLVFTQKDLREVQLAKGSIGAGIATLVKEAGYTLSDIKKVFLAGGFGSYIDHESALGIGLLPEELRGRIISVGNSCGAGVIRCALSLDEMNKTEMILNKTKYIELSSNKGFQDEYMLNMYFPEYD